MLRVLSAMLLGLTLLFPALPVQAATAVVTVNGQPITDVQLAQRLALYKIEGKSSRNAALDELINEALQVQEAQRLGYTVSESEIVDAVSRPAICARSSPTMACPCRRCATGSRRTSPGRG